MLLFLPAMQAYLRLLLASGTLALASLASAESAPPNVLIILADDLGFSDLGSYGGEIDTPTLDRLAADGLRFSQFYNTAKCHSSRISLLTGRYPFQAGNKKLDQAVTLAEALNTDYYTAMVGKWHLDREPQDFGFQRYFGHLSGATNYFLGNNTWRLDRTPWPIPTEGFYATTAKTDYALKFLEEARQTGKPWFLYAAYNAPHAPLQPLKEDYEKYLGRYDRGWDEIHRDRVTRQKLLHLFDTPPETPTRPDNIPAWEELSPAQRDFERRRGAAYAALIDRLDREIGRIVADLEAHGELDNTIILFLSDNGACPYDRPDAGRDGEPYAPGANWSDSTGWAWARNAPFRLYKQNQFEGGITTPAILHWPAGLRTTPGAIDATPLHLIDIFPTIVELAGVTAPTSLPDRNATPVAGESFAALLHGEELADREPIFLQFAADRGLRDGDWKLVSFQEDPWELYNLALDRTELHDLAADYPDQLQRLIIRWHEMAAGIAEVPSRLAGPVHTEVAQPRIHWEWSDYRSDPATTLSERSAKRKNPNRDDD